ncbi:hypothetical protein [Dysgonomonas mossii]|uniref:hypothetical protein n=1 Tax=Dysgonomonas mossii TaxID=163665 RepID=UPI0039911462
MSNKIKLKPPVSVVEHGRIKVIFLKYISVISLFVGACIGLIIWYFFIRCGHSYCVKHNYPIPVIGTSAFIVWIISVAVFKK